MVSVRNYLLVVKFISSEFSQRAVPWYPLQRMAWLQCVVSASKSASRDDTVESGLSSADDVTALLTDWRLTARVSSDKLVYSHIVGQAVPFLSQCCEWKDCPAVVTEPSGDAASYGSDYEGSEGDYDDSEGDY